MDLIWVTKATYEGGYKLRLTFNDGKTGVVDLEPYTRTEIFAPLRDIEVFSQFTVNDWTVSWLEDRLDIAPESLYEHITRGQKE